MVFHKKKKKLFLKGKLLGVWEMPSDFQGREVGFNEACLVGTALIRELSFWESSPMETFSRNRSETFWFFRGNDFADSRPPIFVF
jgi:hypothetical protein